MRTVLLLSITSLCAACADDVKPGSTIERTRVLGVVATPAGGEARAWPRAGEETTLRWLLAAPGELPAVSWRAAICADDLASCASSPKHVAQGEGTPVVSFVAPDAERLYVVAEITPAGEPPTALTFELPVEKSAANHHPKTGAMVFARQPWNDSDCPEVVAGSADIELGMTSSTADRESYTAADGTLRRESLRLSFFSTAGELEGQFRVVEHDDPSDAPESRITWTPPLVEDVPDEGLEVRFTVVVRDLRGGIDWTTRTVCVRK